MSDYAGEITPTNNTPEFNDTPAVLKRLAVPYPLLDTETSQVLGHEQVLYDRGTDTQLSPAFLETADRPGTPEPFYLLDSKPDIGAKSEELHAVAGILLHEGPDTESSQVEGLWGQAAMRLLRQAQESASGTSTSLVAAMVCAVQSPSRDERIDFLRTIYSSGLASATADACAKSSLLLIEYSQQYPVNEQGGRCFEYNVRSVSSYAPIFRLTFNELQSYLIRATGELPVDKRMPPAKQLQRQIADAAIGGTLQTDGGLPVAYASVNGIKVNGYLQDPTRIERFGLQQAFIHAQKEAVLGDDPTDTPLARGLVARRGDASITPMFLDSFTPLRRALNKLDEDMRSVLTALSEPVIEQFDDKATSPFDGQLSRQQQVSRRYRTVMEQFWQYHNLAEYILGYEDFQEAHRQDASYDLAIQNIHDGVWSLSEAGAAAPTAIRDSILNLAYGAVSGSLLGSVSAEEFRDYALSHRRELLSLAAHHLNETPPNIESQDVLLVQDENGHLALQDQPVAVSRGSLAQYSGVVLGCPALREQSAVQQVAPVDRGHRDYASYIDRILEIGINEAYQRGLFNFEQYVM